MRDPELGSGLRDIVFGVDPALRCEGCGCRPHRKRDGTEIPVVKLWCDGCPDAHWLCPGCWVGCCEIALASGAPLCGIVEGWRVAIELEFP